MINTETGCWSRIGRLRKKVNWNKRKCEKWMQTLGINMVKISIYYCTLHRQQSSTQITNLAWSREGTIGNKSRSEKTRRSGSGAQTVLDPTPVTATTTCRLCSESANLRQGSRCFPDRSQNVVDSLACRHQSFRIIIIRRLITRAMSEYMTESEASVMIIDQWPHEKY